MLSARKFILFSVIFLLMVACAPLVGTFEVGVESSAGRQDEGPSVADLVQLEESLATDDTNLASDTGTVNGTVCFPSEIIPAMTAYFQNVITGDQVELAIGENQGAFSIQLPPGDYVAFAYPVIKEFNIGGSYSEAVLCGLQVACTNHALVQFPVRAGETYEGVAICDWYSPDDVPPNPMESASPNDGSPSSLVYSNSDGLWRVASSGVPIKILDRPVTRLVKDGQEAFYEEDGDLWVIELSTRETRNLTNTPDRVEWDPQWWSWSDLVIFKSKEVEEDLPEGMGYLSAIFLDGSGYQVLDSESATRSLPALHPDGALIAYDRGDVPWMFDWDTGPFQFDTESYGLPLVRLVALDNTISLAGNPAWSPDGSQIAWMVLGVFGGFDKMAVVLFDLQDGGASVIHPYQSIDIGRLPPNPVWSPDGQRIAFAVQESAPRGRENALYVVDVESGEESWLGLAGDITKTGLSWSLDGKWLAFNRTFSPDQENLKSGVWVYETSTGALQELTLPEGSLVVGWMSIIGLE